MHRFRPGPALLLAAMLTSSAAMAQDSTAKPLNIHGISYAPSLQLQGKPLLLNGAGVSVGSLLHLESDIRSGTLVRLLPEWTLPKGGVYAVYPPGTAIAPAARAFVELLKGEMLRRA